MLRRPSIEQSKTDRIEISIKTNSKRFVYYLLCTYTQSMLRVLIDSSFTGALMNTYRSEDQRRMKQKKKEKKTNVDEEGQWKRRPCLRSVDLFNVISLTFHNPEYRVRTQYTRRLLL